MRRLPIDWTSVVWDAHDAEIARRLGCGETTVNRHRAALGIAGVPVDRTLPIDWTSVVWDAHDAEIARRLGCSDKCVRRHRIRLKIAPGTYTMTEEHYTAWKVAPQVWTEERRIANRERLKGPLSPEARANRQANLRRTLAVKIVSPEERARRSAGRQGRVTLPETLVKLSVSGKDSWASGKREHQREYVRMLAQSRVGVPVSLETRLNISAALVLLHIERPDYREQVSRTRRAMNAQKRLMTFINLLNIDIDNNSMKPKPNTHHIAPDIQAKLDTAQTLFGTAIENLVKSGAIIADLVNNHRYSVDDIVAYYKDKATAASIGTGGGHYHNAAPRYLIESLLKIGNKQLHPALLFSDMAPARAMMALPFSEQERLLAEGNVEVVKVDPEGKNTEVIQVSLASMPAAQVRQVFGKNEVRSAGAQRAWMVSQVNKGALKAQSQKAATNGPPYRINSKGQFEVPAVGLTLSATDLLSILGQMEAKRR